MLKRFLKHEPSFFGRVCLVLLLWVACGMAGRAETPSLAFDAANKLYEQGKYAEAATAYEKLLGTGQVSAAVYFNLGNAFFKAGQLGRALAAYRQAEQLAPRDPDLRANMQFARDQAQGPTLPANRAQRLLGRLRLNEWTLLAAAAVWVELLLLAAWQLWPGARATLRGTIFAGAAAAVLLCGCAAAAFHTARGADTALVIAREAVVRHGPLEESAETFRVHDGAELRVLDHKDEWLQVSPGPNRVGWLRRDQVLLVSGS